jgi:glutathione S-transferase
MMQAVVKRRSKEDRMAKIEVVTLGWVPPFARGLVRDLRVRWALEEAGLAYQTRLIGPDDQASEGYQRQQPFGQVPAYQEDDLTLFESAAIVLHIAERSEALMPADADGRARATAWAFAALNSIEPPIQGLAEIDLFYPEEQWAKLRRPAAVEAVQARLAKLAAWLNGRDYLEGRFTAGDLLMTTVLRILRHTDLVAQVRGLDAYCRRCEARPAFERALTDQLAVYSEEASPA